MPVTELPRFRNGRKVYFWDERLKQLRNIDDPNDFIDVGAWGYAPRGNLVVYLEGEGWTTLARA
jgi:hypothetical protein